MTRPLASTKVEATGRSYSDHEALEVDLELSISDNKKSNTGSESKEKTHERSLKSSKIRALKSEIENALEGEAIRPLLPFSGLNLGIYNHTKPSNLHSWFCFVLLCFSNGHALCTYTWRAILA